MFNLKSVFMCDLKINSSDRYYRFTFCKSDYLLFHSILKSSLEVFIKHKNSWPSDCSSDRIDKYISDTSELLWQLETQVERQQFFDSKGV